MQIWEKHIKIFFAVLFSCAACALYAQQSNGTRFARERDSILNLISRNPDSERSGYWYYEAAKKCFSLMQYDKVLENAKKSVEIVKKNGDNRTLMEDYMLLGYVYNTEDMPVEALECYLSARKTLEKNPDPKTDAQIVSQIGLVYFSRKHYARAAECFQQAIDSLKTVGAEDDILANIKLLAICNYTQENYSKASEYYEFLLEKYKERDDWPSTKMVYQRLNEVAMKQNDYQKIYKYNSELITLCNQKKDLKESFNAMNNVAYSQVCTGQYDKAVRSFEQLLVLDSTYSHDVSLDAGTHTSLGLCYQNMGDIEKAVLHLRKAVALRQKSDQSFEAATVDNILALIYLKEKDIHNAEFHAVRAVEESEKAYEDGADDDGKLRRDTYMTLNKILTVKGDDKGAMDFYKKYLSLRDSAQVAKELGDRNRADDLQKLTDAEKKYSEKLAEAEINELSSQQLKLLAEKRQNEIDLLTKEREIQQMEHQRIEQALALAQQKEEALKRENELRALQQEQEIAKREQAIKRQQEESEKREREKLELIKDEQIKNQKLQIQNQQKEAEQMKILIFMGTAMILFFIVVFIMMRKKNKKLKEQQKEIERQNNDLLLKNEEITMQKENLQNANNEIMNINNELSRQKAIVEEANKSITDSIVYAQRIQTAVCPPPSFLSKFKLENFLFFRPRDIVSGDYYWFYSDNIDSIFIVAADCTGHGVPGAFMSMLGVSLFNKVVGERNVYEPAEILTELRKEVKEALHQDSIATSQKDGMDLSLIRYDISRSMITFSGANNNGYLVQRFSLDEETSARENLAKDEFLRKTDNGFLKLTIMPADAMPIGIYIREKERFSQTSYKIRKGDSIYMTSDGYIDQFGGKYGRKFLTKNFEKLVLDINAYPLERQKQIVAETHDKWRGGTYSQLDDIIVMGIRF